MGQTKGAVAQAPRKTAPLILTIKGGQFWMTGVSFGPVTPRRSGLSRLSASPR